MASTTGIELGPNTCLLAAVRGGPRSKRAEVFAVARLDGDEWSTDPSALATTLRASRLANGFPRHASIVHWFAAEDSAATPARDDALSAIEKAGFQIASVMSPAEALARLAIERRRGSSSEPVAWLALNTYGAAIAIVRNGELLFSRTFPLVYKSDLPTEKAELLQRYLLVSHVAPELSRGFAAVRKAHGQPVCLVVTCGDLPRLRSLTMPLIEELDVEVETLDSTDGLEAASQASRSRVEELAPSLRLVTTAARADDTRTSTHPLFPALARLAAGAAVIAGVVWVGYSYWRVPKANPVASSASPIPDRASRIPDPASRIPDPESRIPDVPKAPESTPQPVATGGSREPKRAAPIGGSTATEQSRPAASDRRTALQAGPPLQEPLPRIDTVLIDQNRRLAIANGSVVSVGDTIGSRVVIEIARDGIALREPSGRVVRVRPGGGINP
jgi:hypothetical protein